MRLQQVTYLSSERPPRVLRQPAPGQTSGHNLSTEVASSLDLHRRGASLLSTDRWVGLDSVVGGTSVGGSRRCESRAFDFPRAVAAAATKHSACDKCKLCLHREAVMHRVPFHGMIFSSDYLWDLESRKNDSKVWYKMWLILIVAWKHIDGFIKYLRSKGALKKITLNNKS